MYRATKTPRIIDQNIKNNDLVEIKVIAVEMAFVTKNSFFVGDGAIVDSTGQLFNAGTRTPLKLLSENELTLGGSAVGSLSRNNGGRQVSTFDDLANK